MHKDISSNALCTKNINLSSWGTVINPSKMKGFAFQNDRAKPLINFYTRFLNARMANI